MTPTLTRWARIAGVLFVVAGLSLPAARIVHAVLPAQGANYRDKLVAGFWCLKFALMLNGLLLLVLPWLRSALWNRGAPSAVARQPFFRRAATPFDRTDRLILGAILGLALLARLIHAGQSLFGDEVAVQLMFIRRGLPVILTYFPWGTPHHVLYTVLAWFSERLPLPLEISYRLPAILFGVAASGCTYWLARQVLDRFEAVIVGALGAVAMFGVAYSQTAKGYSASQFFVLAIVGAILPTTTEPAAARGWVAFALSLGGLLYIHLYNVYLAFGLGLTWLVVGWLVLGALPGQYLFFLRRAVLTVVVVGAILFLLYALQLPQILELFTKVSRQPEEHLSLHALQALLTQLTFWGTAWPVALACLPLLALGLISLARREPRFTLVATVPLLTIFGIALVLGSWIYSRYLLFVLPFFLIGCVEGARRVGEIAGRLATARTAWTPSLPDPAGEGPRPRGPLVVVTVSLFALLFTVPTVRVLADYYRYGHMDLRGACQAVDRQAQAADAVVGFGVARNLFPLYCPRAQAVNNLVDLEAIVAKTNGRVWLLYSYPSFLQQPGPTWDYLQHQFTVVFHRRGMNMDSTTELGDVYVLESRQN